MNSGDITVKEQNEITVYLNEQMFSVRARNALLNSDFRGTSDMALLQFMNSKSRGDLLRIPNCGKHSVAELMAWRDVHNFKFEQSISEKRAS